MACHPDLDEIQRQTQELRVRNAWNHVFDTVQFPEHLQIQLEIDFLRSKTAPLTFRTDSSNISFHAFSQQDLESQSLMYGCVKLFFQHTNHIFRCTSFPKHVHAFETSKIALRICKTQKDFYTISALTLILFDFKGQKINNGFVLQTQIIQYKSQRQVPGTLRIFLYSYLFELYVRLLTMVKNQLAFQYDEITVSKLDEVFFDTGVMNVDFTTMYHQPEWKIKNYETPQVQASTLFPLLCKKLNLEIIKRVDSDSLSED